MTKTHKRVIAFAAVLAMMVAALVMILPAMSTIKASAAWDGSIATGFGGTVKDESENDQYLIKSAEQLAYLAQKVNNGESYNDRQFLLDADIDLGGLDWTPIGTVTNPFKGRFDGQGHTIKGLNVDGYDNSSLFGVIGGSGKIEKLGVSGYVRGHYYVGGICGSSIDDTTISQCYSTCEVNGNTEVGGICGSSIDNATISQCYSTCEVNGNTEVGGICGSSIDNAGIFQCYSTCEVTGNAEVGGIAGRSNYIEICVNTGKVTGGVTVGGLCGANNGCIIDSYSVGKVSGDGGVGGVCGDNANSVDNCYYLEGSAATGIGSGTGTAAAKTYEELCGVPGSLGFSTYYWSAGNTAFTAADVTVDEANPRKGTVPYTLISPKDVGTPLTVDVPVYNFSVNDTPNWQPYTSIDSAAELVALGNDSSKWGKNYVLSGDIDMEGKTFNPIGNIGTKFTGNFSGDGYAVKNLTINKPDYNYVGLFGYSTGIIMNVGVENGDITGYYDVGGVCGRNEWIISNCHFSGKVNGTFEVGGVCGSAENCNIISCYNNGTITGFDNIVGGICGYMSRGSIENSYNNGKIEGHYGVGGLCGQNDDCRRPKWQNGN